MTTNQPPITPSRLAFLEAVHLIAQQFAAEVRRLPYPYNRGDLATKASQLEALLQAESATASGGAIDQIAAAIERGGQPAPPTPRWSNPYATKSNAQLIEDAKDLDRRATGQPWMIASSNSIRRINACDPNARDGGVISATVAPDGVPDLTGANLNSDLMFVTEARSLVPELARRLEAAKEFLQDVIAETDQMRHLIQTMRDRHG